MRKILLALMLVCLFKTGVNAQSRIGINNTTGCPLWISVVYQDITGCQFFSDVFPIPAGPSVFFYNTVPAPWIPPGCVPGPANDWGYFFTATIYDADPNNPSCMPVSSCTVGSCAPYVPTSAITTASPCSCGLVPIFCDMANPCPPVPPGPQTSILNIHP